MACILLSQHSCSQHMFLFLAKNSLTNPSTFKMIKMFTTTCVHTCEDLCESVLIVTELCTIEKKALLTTFCFRVEHVQFFYWWIVSIKPVQTCIQNCFDDESLTNMANIAKLLTNLHLSFMISCYLMFFRGVSTKRLY